MKESKATSQKSQVKKRSILIVFLLSAFSFLFFTNSPVQVEGATTIKTATTSSILAGYWTFDEATSTRLGDFSGYGNNGTLNNFSFPATLTSGWTSLGKRGGALIFDGVDDYTAVLKPPSVGTSPNVFTISAWMYPDNQYARFITPSSHGIDQWIGYDAANQRLEVQITESADVNNRNRPSTTGSVPYNTWTHWAVTINDKEIRIYINGQLNASYTETINIGGWIDTWTIGQRGNSSSYYKGRLDDLRVYSRALSASEVSALYRTGQVTAKLVTKNGLIGHWMFDEATSTRTGDFSGRGYNGTLTNMDANTDWVRGIRGGALDFDGTNDFVDIGSLSSSDFDSSTLTLTTWIYPTSIGGGNYRGIIAMRDACGNANFQLHLHNSTGELAWHSSSAFNSGYIPPVNQWTHITATVNGTTLALYANGVSVGGGTISARDLSHSLLRIGTDGTCGNDFAGRIDDTRIYTRILSTTEIASLYNQNQTSVNTAQTQKMTSGLVGFWSFNGADVDTTYVYDRSGVNNHGYFSGVSTSSAKTTGKSGQGIILDGSNDIVTVPTSSSLDIVGPITLSAWIRTSGSNDYSGIIKKNTGLNGYQFGLGTSGGLRADFYDGVTYISPTSAVNVEDNEWHHVVATYDGNTARIYVDGVQNGSQPTGSGFVTTAVAPLIVGNDSCCGGRFFNGKIDEVRVYNRALSASEVKRLYLLGR